MMTAGKRSVMKNCPILRILFCPLNQMTAVSWRNLGTIFEQLVAKSKGEEAKQQLGL